jgi:protein-S-isoprenylcysteine O-methyltransferase Ste14
VRATEFEFRYRSLLNLIHFWIAFLVYFFDHTNVARAIVHWAAGASPLRALLFTRLIFAFGTLLTVLAAASRTWAAAYLRSDVVHDTKLHSDLLVADGPYRYVRNPLYLGTFLLTIALGLFTSRTGFVILAGGAAIRILRLIGREEVTLEEQQGEGFREYCRRVPRLIPSIMPRVPAGGLKPRWAQAFVGEAFIWCCVFAMIAVTITSRLGIGWTILGAAVAVWAFDKIVRMKQRKSARA